MRVICKSLRFPTYDNSLFRIQKGRPNVMTGPSVESFWSHNNLSNAILLLYFVRGKSWVRIQPSLQTANGTHCLLDCFSAYQEPVWELETWSYQQKNHMQQPLLSMYVAFDLGTDISAALWSTGAGTNFDLDFKRQYKNSPVARQTHSVFPSILCVT